jgi:xylulokinase
MQADVYGQPACTINAEEGPAYGVALLAGVGTGVWSSVQEACGACIRVVSQYRPERKARSVYRRFYPVFRRLYRSLRKDFDRITVRVGKVYG